MITIKMTLYVDVVNTCVYQIVIEKTADIIAFLKLICLFKKKNPLIYIEYIASCICAFTGGSAVNDLTTEQAIMFQ